MSTQAQRTLVVLFECRGAEAIVPEVVSRAEGGDVIVLQVIDPAYTDRLCRKLRTDGWMGAEKSQELGAQVQNDYLARFDKTVDGVCQLLTDEGLEISRERKSGDLVNTTLRTAEKEEVSRVIVGRPHRSLLARFLDGLNTRVLIDRAPCPVDLIDLPDE